MALDAYLHLRGTFRSLERPRFRDNVGEVKFTSELDQETP